MLRAQHDRVRMADGDRASALGQSVVHVPLPALASPALLLVSWIDAHRRIDMVVVVHDLVAISFAGRVCRR